MKYPSEASPTFAGAFREHGERPTDTQFVYMMATSEWVVYVGEVEAFRLTALQLMTAHSLVIRWDLWPAEQARKLRPDAEK